MAEKIVITSGKGGVGKTTVTANLGMQLAWKGRRVLLCDTDFGLNNIDVVTGVEKKIVYDIVDVVEGRCRAKQAVVQHDTCKNLYVLASNRSRPDKYISPQMVRMVLDSLSGLYDYILIDSPAGIDAGFHRAAASAESALVVTTPHISSLRDADKVISVLRSYRMKKTGLVINMVRGDMVVEREILAPREIGEILRLPLVAIIPENDGVFLNRPRGEAEKAFRMLAETVAGGNPGVLDATRKYSGLFGGLRRSLRKNL